jgi:hypothetical protein
VRDPDDLYELTGDLGELGRPVLLQILTGFVDAGNATYRAAEHLLTSLTAERVVTFDADQLIDYRSRRPPMIFDEYQWVDYADPTLGLHLLRDEAGTPFLLLAGPEPDLQWERFIQAIEALIRRAGVRLTVGLNAIPMAVPHTRPVGITAHATRRDLIVGYEPWLNRIQVPGSVGNLLEYRLGRAGHDAVGFAVHVPHYLAQSKATGLMLPTADLREAAKATNAEVDKQVAQTDEAATVVRSLEQQYDAYVAARPGSNLLAQSGPLPTAEELGAELERFLADRDRPAE